MPVEIKYVLWILAKDNQLIVISVSKELETILLEKFMDLLWVAYVEKDRVSVPKPLSLC